MIFSSFSFIFIFLPITLLGFYLLPTSRLQLAFLLVASIVFYCRWSAPYSLLMLFTVCFDFVLASLIARTENKRQRRLFLLLSLTTNLTILGLFKYYGFFAVTVNSVTQTFFSTSTLPLLRVVLPIGISFYTFQSMSYVIDVYRKSAHAHRRFLPFASYVTMFPHQICGPLVRHDTIVPQLESPSTFQFHAASFWQGCFFFVLGLSKKILIADRLAIVVNPLVGGLAHASKMEAILAILGYTMQLYFDFSGYSDMAVGLGRMLNIRFPQNFNSPYKSRSITEFWRRWHITLSAWLRDYLYISLGGNRRGVGCTYFNIMVTMLLGGLWHGANWTFVFWGFLHGAVLCLERVFSIPTSSPNRIISLLRWAVTFFLVNIGWIFFRAPTFKTGFLWLKKIFYTTSGRVWDISTIPAAHKSRFLVAIFLSIPIVLFGKNTFELEMRATSRNALMLALLFALCLMYLHEESIFLYFQF